ncbi:MAG: VOC family protein [Deltaproteobacteria bacterium]|nr:VOC family protein [Deltaproteobacteria bacterium]
MRPAPSREPQRLVRLHLLALCALLASCNNCQRKQSPLDRLPDPLFMGELGLDHVGIAVKRLAAARSTFHEDLGFGALEDGKLPNGIQNTNYYFEDGTYLETLDAWDSNKQPALAAFTQEHEGGYFAVLSIASAAATKAAIEARGVKMGTPIEGTIQTKATLATPGAAPRWQTLFFADHPWPESPLYFIEYAQPARGDMLKKLEAARSSGRIYHHPNSAVGIKAVWLAVPALDAAVSELERAGFSLGAAVSDPRLQAHGRLVGAGQGKLLLLTPDAQTGPVADELRARPQTHVFGLSIETRRVDHCAKFAQRAVGHPVPITQGLFGDSVLVPPQTAHGAWLELFQRPEAR